jgi:predicted transcriptional regulator of viral defense system
MTVPATRILASIRSAGLRLFTLADVMNLCSLSASAAAHALSRLQREELVTRIVRGVYANRMGPAVHPFEAVPYLAAPWPAYVSLHSALSACGVVDQIPAATYGVTPGRSRRLRTPLGELRLHHIQPSLFWGYRWEETPTARYPIAEPEKAIVDCLYLEVRAGRGVALFPELHLRGTVDRERLRAYVNRAADARVAARARVRRLLGPGC